MKLMEVTRRLHQLDANATIYATRPWRTDSAAHIREEPEDRLVPEDLEKDGYEYFLEVFVAKEVVPNLSHVEPSFTLEQWCERLISYAENDA